MSAAQIRWIWRASSPASGDTADAVVPGSPALTGAAVTRAALFRARHRRAASRCPAAWPHAPQTRCRCSRLFRFRGCGVNALPQWAHRGRPAIGTSCKRQEAILYQEPVRPERRRGSEPDSTSGPASTGPPPSRAHHRHCACGPTVTEAIAPALRKNRARPSNMVTSVDGRR